jgi:hypothetical protein
VLHTVGPVVAGRRVQPEDERTLAAACVSCLELARSIRTVRTLAFCAISTGVFGYPKGPSRTPPGPPTRPKFTVCPCRSSNRKDAGGRL